MLFIYYKDQIDGVVQALVSLAHELEIEHPDKKIVGVGHSPSWLVYTVGQIRRQKGCEPDIGYVPFSSRHMDLKEKDYSNEDREIFFKNFAYGNGQKNRPNDETISNYFTKLSPQSCRSIGIDGPQSNKKILFLDMIMKGLSFASFIDILHRHLETTNNVNLKNNFQYQVFKPLFDAKGDVVFKLPDINDENFYDVNVSVRSQDKVYALHKMAGESGSFSNIGGENDLGRFMPYFGLEKDKVPSRIDGGKDLVKIIRDKIQKAIHDYDGCTPAINLEIPESQRHWIYRPPMRGYYS